MHVIARLFSPTFQEFSLRPRWKAGALLLAIGLSGLLVVSATVRIAIATRLGGSFEIFDLHKALLFDPLDAEVHHRLGLLYAYTSTDAKSAESVKHLRRAVELNPHRAMYWVDLGAACNYAGDVACADQAFERARILSPETPRIQWLVANYYLQRNRVDTALESFQRLVVMSPEYAVPTFRICLRVVGNPEVVYEKVLPPGSNPRVKLAYINYLAAHDETELASRVWDETVAEGPPFSFWLAEPYLQRLLDLNRGREAAKVWQDLERLGIVKSPAEGERQNLFFNGDFEQWPLNTGLDWRYREVPYVSVDFLDPSAYHGTHCLRLDFTVSRNDESEPVYQFVPVVPNQKYILTAFARSEGISSDSGPRLHVLDPACPSCLNTSSASTVGTTPWHSVSANFSTGAHTQFVQISIWRPRSRTFRAEISGSFWLDCVSLQISKSASETAALPPKPRLWFQPR